MAVHLNNMILMQVCLRDQSLDLLLFVIFISELLDKIVSQMSIFADDITLYNRHKGKTNVHVSKAVA